MLEKTLASPLVYKEIQPVHPKGDQSWLFIGMTDAEAETPKLWPPDAKNWLTGKDPDEGKDGKRRGWQRMRLLDSITDSMHMSLSKLWELDGQGNLACCSPWGCRVGHDWVTELNWLHDGLDVLGPLKIACFCLDLVTHHIPPFLTVCGAFSVTCHWCLNSTMLMRTTSTIL